MLLQSPPALGSLPCYGYWSRQELTVSVRQCLVVAGTDEFPVAVMSLVQAPEGKATLSARANGSLSDAAGGFHELTRLPAVQDRKQCRPSDPIASTSNTRGRIHDAPYGRVRSAPVPRSLRSKEGGRDQLETW